MSGEEDTMRYGARKMATEDALLTPISFFRALLTAWLMHASLRQKSRMKCIVASDTVALYVNMHLVQEAIDSLESGPVKVFGLPEASYDSDRDTYVLHCNIIDTSENRDSLYDPPLAVEAAFHLCLGAEATLVWERLY